jgi:hypothetical protein
MGYSNNRNVLPLTDKNNFYTDGCGRNYESKYYVNGAYIDLCGLTPEEYMNNPCCGGNSNPGSNSGKAKNNIQIISYEENGVIYYQAVADYPVTSTIKIRVVNDNTESITELDIYAGNLQSEPEVAESITIKDASIDIDEDDVFEYVPNIKDDSDVPEDTKYNVYVDTLHLNEVKSLTIDKIKLLPLYSIEDGTTIDMKFTIPATDVNINDMEDDEYNQFCEDNQYAFVIILPKKTYENKNYSIFNYGGVNIMDNFQYESSYTIDNENYVCIVEKAKEDIMPYIPRYNEDLIYEYKLTIKK